MPFRIDKDAIVEHQNDRLRRPVAWIERVGRKASEVAARRCADVERHADAFALVVITAAGYWANISGARTNILREHLGISLETAAGQHHRAALQHQRLILWTGRFEN